MRLVRELRGETGIKPFAAVTTIAGQLGYGVEALRRWVNQTDVDDGKSAGTTNVRRLGELNSSSTK